MKFKITFVYCIYMTSLILCSQKSSAKDHSFNQNTGDEGLNQLAEEIAKKYDIPSITLAWARLGEKAHVGCYGIRSIETKEPVTVNDKYHIGSITKSVTATLIGKLVEKGMLRWDSTLEELLPDFKMKDVYRKVTIQQLLRHRSRLVQHEYLEDEEMDHMNAIQGKDQTDIRANYLRDEVLNLDPLEEGFHYSNAGYTLAGFIAEKLTGKDWRTLIREEIFTPLEMKSGGFDWPTKIDPHQPIGHVIEDGKQQVQNPKYTMGPFTEPTGNIHCTAADLIRYAQAHLAGLKGTKDLLEVETIKELHRPAKNPAYACGWGVYPDTGQHGHRGSAGTFLAFITLDPKHEVVMVVFMNQGGEKVEPVPKEAAEQIISRFVVKD